MELQDDLPNPYISSINYGPKMIVPILPKITFNLEEDLNNPMPDWGRAEYRLISYREDYHWGRVETHKEYLDRLVKEIESWEDLIWILHGDGYPKYAGFVVEIKPAWIYRRIS